MTVFIVTIPTDELPEGFDAQDVDEAIDHFMDLHYPADSPPAITVVRSEAIEELVDAYRTWHTCTQETEQRNFRTPEQDAGYAEALRVRSAAWSVAQARMNSLARRVLRELGVRP